MIFGLQWLAITMATVIIIGKVVAGLHFSDPARQLVYMQKLYFVMAVPLFFAGAVGASATDYVKKAIIYPAIIKICRHAINLEISVKML